MNGLGKAVAIGLLAAGLVHVASLKVLTRIAGVTPYERMAALLPNAGFQALDNRDLRFADPFTHLAACRLMPGPDPILIDVQAPNDVWTLTLYRADGLVLASMNDRAVTGESLQVVVMTEEATGILGRSGSLLPEGTLVIDSDDEELIALVRVLDASSEGLSGIGATMRDWRCGPAHFNAPRLEEEPSNPTDPVDDTGDRRAPPAPEPRPGT